MFTGQYSGRRGMWKNGIALDSQRRYACRHTARGRISANYIGKWHLAPGITGSPDGPETQGPVNSGASRRILDIWQAANTLELTSHAYEGDLHDSDGKPIHFSGVYAPIS